MLIKTGMLCSQQHAPFQFSCDAIKKTAMPCIQHCANPNSCRYARSQVHAHAKNKNESARYCSATMQRQLVKDAVDGSLNVNDWVQNCLQLAGFYNSCNAFALAEYLLKAAEEVARLQADKGECTQNQRFS